MPNPVSSTFLVVLSLIFGGYWLFDVRPEQEEQTRLQRRIGGGAAKPTKGEVGAADSVVRREATASAVPWLDRLIKQQPAWSTRDEPHPACGNGDHPRDARTALRACGRGRLRGGVWFGTRFWFLALFVGGLAAFAPVAVVRFKATRRVRQFEEQFPEAIDLLARALRAGHAFTTGLVMVGSEMHGSGRRRVPSDVRPADLRYAGSRHAPAVRGAHPLIDAKFFATAVLTQREAGGNLSEVLDNLASVIRERFRVKRQVRVVTADKRVTGWVLRTAAVLAIALSFLSWDR